MKELRDIIRDLREDHDLKQKTVAEYLDISQQTYSNYEKKPWPSGQNLWKLYENTSDRKPD